MFSYPNGFRKLSFRKMSTTTTTKKDKAFLQQENCEHHRFFFCFFFHSHGVESFDLQFWSEVYIPS